MFIGHAAMGFGAKRFAPQVSLGTLMLAATVSDLLWVIFLVAGVERVEVRPGHTAVSPFVLLHFPYSHSLAAALVLALLVGGAYALITGLRREAGVLALVALSHWVLDFISHIPDLALYPGSSTMLGLGLWRSVPGTIIVEGGLFALGVWLYLRCTRAKDRVGTYALWGFVGLLGISYIGSIFGPPPPPEPAKLALGNVTSLGIMVLLSWWVDRHREIK